MKAQDCVSNTAYTQERDVEILKQIGLIPVTQYSCQSEQDILNAIEQIGNTRHEFLIVERCVNDCASAQMNRVKLGHVCIKHSIHPGT